METIESKRRSRVVRIGSTIGIVGAAALVAWGFSGGSDDRSPTSPTSSPLGAINGPAEVLTTQPVGAPSGSSPDSVDVAVPLGSVDVAFPPASSDIATP